MTVSASASPHGEHGRGGGTGRQAQWAGLRNGPDVQNDVRQACQARLRAGRHEDHCATRPSAAAEAVGQVPPSGRCATARAPRRPGTSSPDRRGGLPRGAIDRKVSPYWPASPGSCCRIRPALPMPVTATRPRHFRIASIASTNESPSFSAGGLDRLRLSLQNLAPEFEDMPSPLGCVRGLAFGAARPAS